MATVQLKVSGMKCTACEQKIVEGLKALEGVEEVKADHKAGAVEVSFDPEKVEEGALKEKIAELGFEVVEGEPPKKESLLKQLLGFFRR